MKNFFAKMKINCPVRFKNPWFWIGLGGTILAAMDVTPEMFTSWQYVWDSICSLFANPFRLGCVAIAILGVFIDPTTYGVGDSTRALAYKRPFKG